MSIPASVIFCWNGTHAGIPAGWARETTLDAKYPKGTALGVNPNVTGGTATHTHTSPAHEHLLNNHTHTYSLANATGNTQVLRDAGAGSGGIYQAHTHTGTTGNPSGGGLSSVTSSYDTFANDPPYHEVIFIKPSAPVNGLVDDGICFVDTSSTLGFTFCNGENSTPDLRNKYLKGAGTGENAGTTGGTYTNVHDIVHTHSVASHTHANSTSGASPANNALSGGTNNMSIAHTHTVYAAAATASLAGESISQTTTEIVEPAYMKLIPVQNKTGALLEVVGMIGMWLGTLADIPSGWSELPFMRGKHLKCANTTSEAYTSGGSNTHVHAAQNHTHVGSAHTHTGTHSAHVNVTTRKEGGADVTNHQSVHTVTIANATSVHANASTSADSSSNEPEYRTVAFIKLTNIISGGSFLFSML